MSAPLSAVAFAAVAAAALPAHAQDRRDGAVRDDVHAIERRTWKLLREKGPSVLSVRVVTHAINMPRILLPGVTIAPPGGAHERVDASGFVATDDGHIVTTAAALRDAAFVEVCFADGTVRDADVVGVDGPFRIAVLRTRPPENTEPLSVPVPSRSADDALGWFFQAAAGRPDVQISTVKAANTQATTYDRYLYATQPLVDGAAGGPLVRGDGRLLGMAVGEVRQRVTRDSRSVPGPPATLFVQGADVHAAVRDIVRYGAVRRPMLGVVMDRDTNRIDQLLPGGPAERAGLREGDCVVAVAGTPVESLADLTRALLRRTIGETVALDIDQGGEVVERKVELADVRMPQLPKVEPLPGVELQLAAEDNEDGTRTVTVTDVRIGSTLYTAGLRVGDRVLSVDDRDVLRFLGRHRIRPVDALPHTITIDRDGRRHTIALGR